MDSLAINEKLSTNKYSFFTTPHVGFRLLFIYFIFGELVNLDIIA